MSYESLETAIAEWAAAETNVRTVFVIGSRARKIHLADVWSDLDLILRVATPQAYVDDAGWLDAFPRFGCGCSISPGPEIRKGWSYLPVV